MYHNTTKTARPVVFMSQSDELTLEYLSIYMCRYERPVSFVDVIRDGTSDVVGPSPCTEMNDSPNPAIKHRFSKLLTLRKHAYTIYSNISRL